VQVELLLNDHWRLDVLVGVDSRSVLGHCVPVGRVLRPNG
jgi:hypothetical protein